MTGLQTLLAVAWCAAGLLAGAPVDLDTVRKERDPNKRSQLALTYAMEQVQASRAALDRGDLDGFRAALEQVVAGVRLSDDSVRSTGKAPSKSPKHFKRAELKMRDVLRRLQSLADYAGVDDRPPVEQAREAVREVHDNLVLDIVGRR